MQAQDAGLVRILWVARVRAYDSAYETLHEPPTADPHGGWCGGWALETPGYLISPHCTTNRPVCPQPHFLANIKVPSISTQKHVEGRLDLQRLGASMAHLFAEIVPMKDGNAQRMKSIGCASKLDRWVEPICHARDGANDSQRDDHAFRKRMQQIALDFQHYGKESPIFFNRVGPTVEPRHARSRLLQPECTVRQLRTRWAYGSRSPAHALYCSIASAFCCAH